MAGRSGADGGRPAGGEAQRHALLLPATTLASGVAAERGLPGIWLTPLLHERSCVDGLRRRTAPALLVGGTRDEAWDGDLARELGDEVLELEGADHGLARIADLPLIVEAVSRFAARFA